MTSAIKETDWCCVAAVNRPDILAANLAASPALIARPERLNIQRDPVSAAIAYNQGLDETRAEIVVFAHQDVYLPKGWDQMLMQAVGEIAAHDPAWAVLGLIGKTSCNRICGRVWSTGLAREVGDGTGLPAPAASIDELLIVLRRSSGLRFDPGLPSFHLYGTDIVQTALKAGYGAYIVDAPVIHNSRAVRSLQDGFAEAYAYLQKKLADRLPVPTLVARLDEDGRDLETAQGKLEANRWRRTFSRRYRLLRTDWRWFLRTPTARAIAARLEYERKD